MADFSASRESNGRGKQALKTCPWCRGHLVFNPSYPLNQLFPGSPSVPSVDRLPEPLRTVPAWACKTPHCRFREPA
jgi:hypothetical protein